MNEYHNRPPDLEFPGVRIWFINPEAKEQALKKMVVGMYKRWRKGELVFESERTVKNIAAN